MVGWFSFDGDRRQVTVEQVLGLPMLHVKCPLPQGRWRTGRQVEGQIGWAVRQFHGSRCRRVLWDKGCPHTALLGDAGLRTVEVAPFCRAMAVPLVMTSLARAGVASNKACVRLVGQRVDADMSKTAMSLCPRVHSLIIEAPYGGGQLAVQLQRRFGVAILKEGSPHVTVVFSTVPGVAWGEDALMLFGTQPRLGNFALHHIAGNVPTELEELSLLALLWERSGGDIGHVAVVPVSFGGN